jgi:hypothetical protein
MSKLAKWDKVTPSYDWIQRLWKFVADSADSERAYMDSLSRLSKWSLVPVSGGRLCSCSLASEAVCILPDTKESSTLFSMFDQMGLPVLEPEFNSWFKPLLKNRSLQKTIIYGLNSARKMWHVELSEMSEGDMEYLLAIIADLGGSSQFPYNSEEIRLIKSFPFFQTLGGEFVSLSLGNYYLSGSNDTDIFVKIPNANYHLLRPDHRTFLKFLGVRELNEANLFEKMIFPTFSNLTEELQYERLVFIRENFPRLCNESGTFKDSLKKLPFVPVGSGSRRIPGELYARYKILSQIFDPSEFFPAGIFGSDDWIGFLMSLGLKTNINHEVFLESALYIAKVVSADRT